MKLRFLFSLMLGAALTAGAQGYQDGVDNYNAGRLSIAKEILNNTINDPSTDKAVSYYYLGSIDFADNNLTGAKANFDRGVAANPQYPYNYIGQGEILLKQGDKSGAQKLFDQAIKMDKKDHAIVANVARAYWNVDPKPYMEGDEDAARPKPMYIKEIDKYITKAFKDSKNTEPAVYMLQGDMAATINPGYSAGMYEMAIDQDRQRNNVNREAYVKYAHVYDMHNRKLVIEKLEELNELEPNSGLAQRELAETYYRNRQFTNAWKQYERYVQNPNHFRHDEQLYSSLLYAAGQHNDAILWADKVLAQAPESYDMYRMKMLSNRELGNDSLAILAGQELFSHPKAELINNDYIAFGDILAKNGKTEDAVAVYEMGKKAAAGDEDKERDYIKRIINAYQQGGNPDKAIELQMAYLESGKATASDYYGVYQSYFEKSRVDSLTNDQKIAALDEAEKYLKKALEVEPMQPLYMYRLVNVDYVRNGGHLEQAGDEAVKMFFDLINSGKIVTDSENIRNMCGSIYNIMGISAINKDKDKAKAMEYYQMALEYLPGNQTIINKIDKIKAELAQ